MKQALGELAYCAFEQDSAPFQLSSLLLEQVWEKRKLPERWLETLQNVGILYPIQVLDDGLDTAAYTFLHPVFQEYFAAQFIDDSKLLFNPNYRDPKDPHANYYALELRWQRIFFLWLNRSEIPDAEKDSLLKALISVENTCGGFYYYRAYFLAAEGLREFKQSRYATEILRQVVQWSFEQFDPFPIEGGLTSRLIDEATRVLYKSDAQQVVSVLKEFFWDSHSDPFFQCSVASRLGLFEQGKQFAIQQLDRLLQSSDPFVHSDAALSLYCLAPDRSGLTDVLSLLLDPHYDESIRLSAATLLKEVGSAHQKRATETLYHLSKAAEDDEVRESATFMVWYLEDFTDLIDLPDSSTSDSPEQLDDGSAAPLPSLADVLEQLSFYSLGEPQAKGTVQVLFDLLFEPDSLINTLLDRETAIQVIRVLKQQCIYGDDLRLADYGKPKSSILLQRCAEVVPFSVFHEAWHSGETVY